MKPVVRNANIATADLLADLVNERSHDLTGKGGTHATDVLRQLVSRLNNAMRRGPERRPPDWDDVAEAASKLVSSTVDNLPSTLLLMGAKQATALFLAKPELPALLVRMSDAIELPRTKYIHKGPDNFAGESIGFPAGKQPADYLEEFGRFIDDNMNLIPALAVVVQRPRDLTRAQLKELRLKLNIQGFSEAALRTAWRKLRNEDIAATIVGFIRQRALGSALVPYADRVDRALKKVLGSRQWTPPERRWLERIAEQLRQEVVVDEAAFDKGAFVNAGGWRGVDRALGGRLRHVLATMADEIWIDEGRAA